MALKQINLAFDAAQDRLLMRISTQDGREYRAWLTRRIVRALLPAIDRSLQQEAAIDSGTQTPQAAEAVSAFRHQAAVAQARFTRGYEEATPVLGDEPLLVSRVQLRRLDADQYLWVLAPAQGEAIQLRLGGVLLHGTVKLLRDTVRLADWDLAVPEPAPSDRTAAIN